MMYQYYAPIYLEEHLLLASEIAELYGIYTEQDLPHARLITALINQKRYVVPKDFDIPFYYHSSKDLLRVYPKCLYEQVINDFFKQIEPLKEEIKTIKITLGQKSTNYKFKLKK